MTPTTRATVVIDDFLGLASNTGRLAVEQTAMVAAVQVNLRSVAMNEMSTRPGLRRVTYDELESQ